MEIGLSRNNPWKSLTKPQPQNQLKAKFTGNPHLQWFKKRNMVSSKEFREKKSSDQLLVNKGSHFKDWSWSPIVFASINNPMINQDRSRCLWCATAAWRYSPRRLRCVSAAPAPHRRPRTTASPRLRPWAPWPRWRRLSESREMWSSWCSFLGFFMWLPQYPQFLLVFLEFYGIVAAFVGLFQDLLLVF